MPKPKLRRSMRSGPASVTFVDDDRLFFDVEAAGGVTPKTTRYVWADGRWVEES